MFVCKYMCMSVCFCVCDRMFMRFQFSSKFDDFFFVLSPNRPEKITTMKLKKRKNDFYTLRKSQRQNTMSVKSVYNQFRQPKSNAKDAQ